MSDNKVLLTEKSVCVLEPTTTQPPLLCTHYRGLQHDILAAPALSTIHAGSNLELSILKICVQTELLGESRDASYWDFVPRKVLPLRLCAEHQASSHCRFHSRQCLVSGSTGWDSTPLGVAPSAYSWRLELSMGAASESLSIPDPIATRASLIVSIQIHPLHTSYIPRF